MRTRTIGVATLAALVVGPAAAQAHVTVNPTEAVAGAYQVLTVRVPNERDDASTRKVVLQMPEGFLGVSYQPVAGWDVQVKRRTLDTPIETPDGPISEVVGTVTWTATDKGAQVAPGQFQEFPLSAQIPGEPGDTLTFKALQTYSDGDVVRWIGAPDSEEPAATVAVEEPDGDEQGSHGGTTAATPDDADDDAGDAESDPASAPVAVEADDDSDDGGSDGLAVAALIVGALGLVTGIGALATSRRRAA